MEDSVPKEKSPFVGRKIKAVRPMTEAEGEREGWSFGRHGPPMVIVLDDGALVYASRDPEGNGPGALFAFAEGQTLSVG